MRNYSSIICFAKLNLSYYVTMFNSPPKPKIVAIYGPTSSGKSALAVQLAKKFHGEVLSADSRQVYRGLNIASGKVTKKEMSGVSHYLLDVASPKRIFAAEEYQKLSRKVILSILKKRKLPIIAGGTGFYLDTALDGSILPAVPANPALRKKLEKKSCDELYKELNRLDPRRATTIDRFNKRRLIRALEIIHVTKKPVPVVQKKSTYDVLKIGIAVPFPDLKKRIAHRLRARFRKGLISEIDKLHKQGVSWQRLNELGLECRYVSFYLRGLLDKKEMEQKLEKEIVRYAKRQMTWFKNNPEIIWIKNKKEAEKNVSKFINATSPKITV